MEAASRAARRRAQLCLRWVAQRLWQTRSHGSSGAGARRVLVGRLPGVCSRLLRARLCDAARQPALALWQWRCGHFSFCMVQAFWVHLLTPYCTMWQCNGASVNRGWLSVDAIAASSRWHAHAPGADSAIACLRAPARLSKERTVLCKPVTHRGTSCVIVRPPFTSHLAEHSAGNSWQRVQGFSAQPLHMQHAIPHVISVAFPSRLMSASRDAASKRRACVCRAHA